MIKPAIEATATNNVHILSTRGELLRSLQCNFGELHELIILHKAGVTSKSESNQFLLMEIIYGRQATTVINFCCLILKFTPTETPLNKSAVAPVKRHLTSGYPESCLGLIILL